MGCCIAVAYLIALIRRGFRYATRRPTEIAVDFPPPAVRSAPELVKEHHALERSVE